MPVLFILPSQAIKGAGAGLKRTERVHVAAKRRVNPTISRRVTSFKRNKKRGRNFINFISPKFGSTLKLLSVYQEISRILVNFNQKWILTPLSSGQTVHKRPCRSMSSWRISLIVFLTLHTFGWNFRDLSNVSRCFKKYPWQTYD